MYGIISEGIGIKKKRFHNHLSEMVSYMKELIEGSTMVRKGLTEGFSRMLDFDLKLKDEFLRGTDNRVQELRTVVAWKGSGRFFSFFYYSLQM